MAVVANIAPSTKGRWVPSAKRVVLPGCEVCHMAHPLARSPQPEDVTRCPDCGHPSTTGPTETDVPAEITGIAGWLYKAADWLTRQAEKLQ